MSADVFCFPNEWISLMLSSPVCLWRVCVSRVPRPSAFPVVQLIAVYRLGPRLSGSGLWARPSAHGVLVDGGVGLGRGVVARRTAVGLAAVVAVPVVHRAVVIV